ncbi:hypothetical protein [Roseovarius sp.]|uniref:hypothetical protein n=1 Tax=Roseovarius sp. TaxID=1486281 RepID=UPI003BA9E6CE
MKGLSLWFMVLGLIAALAGMSWGLYMSGIEDHSLSPAHGHLNLLGFVAFSVFAFYYHAVPGADVGLLPTVHFLLSVAGLALMIPGIALAIEGGTPAFAVAGSVISALGMLAFLVVVLRGAHAG